MRLSVKGVRFMVLGVRWVVVAGGGGWEWGVQWWRKGWMDGRMERGMEVIDCLCLTLQMAFGQGGVLRGMCLACWRYLRNSR